MNNAVNQIFRPIQWPEQNNNPLELGFLLNLQNARTPISRVNSFQTMQELSEDNQQLLHMVNQLLKAKLNFTHAAIEDSVLRTAVIPQSFSTISSLGDKNFSALFKMIATYSIFGRIYLVRENQKSSFNTVNTIMNHLVHQYGETTALQLSVLNYDDPDIGHKVAEILQFGGRIIRDNEQNKVIEFMNEIKSNTPILKKYYIEILNTLNQFSFDGFIRAAAPYRIHLENVADMIGETAPAVRDEIRPKLATFK